jgi:hypothetical protein
MGENVMMRYEPSNEEVDRRESARRPYIGPRMIYWKPIEFGHPKSRGWMNDVSASGMSFVTNVRNRPKVGDEVEVIHAADGDTLVCRVVRIQFLESALARVGCQISIADLPAHGSNTPRRFDCIRVNPRPKIRRLAEPGVAPRLEEYECLPPLTPISEVNKSKKVTSN